MTSPLVPADEVASEAESLLDRLGRRLEEERARGGSAAERAARLARLEGELFGLCARHPPLVPGARDRALVAGAAWRSVLGRRCPSAAPSLATFLDERLTEAARAFAKEVREGSDLAPASCVRRLAEATELERELHDLGHAAQAGLSELAAARTTLRAALLEGLSVAPAPEDERAAWARELTDRAGACLTGLDELPRERAARHLARVADDLAWHAAHVEAQRGARARRLKRVERRLTAAAQERELEARLDRRFGAARVLTWERVVFGAIVLVLGLMLVELLVPVSPALLIAIVAVDTLGCGVLLIDFAVRLAHAPGRWRWFKRHVWLDLLPSLPLSWLALAHVGGEPLHAGVGLRLIQLPRFARALRVLLPLLRLLRAIGFLARGLDRMARAYAPLLDRDVILHPTREERRAAEHAERGLAARTRRLVGALETEWEALLETATEEERPAVSAARLTGLACAPPAPHARSTALAARETTAESVLDRLSSASPAALAAALDPDLLARAARAVRLFARWPLRWTPFVRRYLPRLAPGSDDAQVVTAFAQSSGAELARHHQRWLWFADLYGTLTPAEFVDRLGTAMMRTSIRPASRLTFFGGFYLVALALFVVLGGTLLAGVIGWLRRIVETPLLVLGAVCFAVLGVGWWLRRVASQATAFYESLSAAQHLELMETIKTRRLSRDARLIERRVLARDAGGRAAPHGQLRARVEAWLVEPSAQGEGAATSDAVGRVALLWRDGLDGALFLESDARTARQLLGNPVLAALRRRSARVDKKELKELVWLDFDRPRSSLRGPHVWFSFLAQAVVQTVGRLIADYNRSALPLAEHAAASPEERARHAAWLEARRGTVPAAGREATRRLPPAQHVAGDFLALHFLDDDETRDREILRRYGPEVLARLVADRRFVLRRIFGTYPLHLRPRSRRSVNLRAVYEGWFARGRALLLPFRLLARTIAFSMLLLRWIFRAVREVRRPELQAADEAAQADFATAVRKIDRVRGPLADACLWLRARLDADYLGLALAALPGSSGGGDVDDDLAFLGRRGVLSERVEGERVRARADLARLERLLEGGLLERLAARLERPVTSFGPEHLRALLAAYRMDLDHVRTLTSATELLEEAAAVSLERALSPRCPFLRWKLWLAFRRWWAGRAATAQERRSTWRAIAHDVGGAGRALQVLDLHGAQAARAEGESRLAEVLRHPGRVGEMLLTTRAVQTLSLLDILHYREHVYRVGGYAESGDAPGPWLTLGPSEAPSVG